MATAKRPAAKTSKAAAKATKAAAKPPVKKAAPRKNAPATLPVVKHASTSPPQPAPEPKPKKAKLVRDSFTIPKDEYAVIDVLKARSARLGHAAKKSEVLRAGLKALVRMADDVFRAAMGAVPAIKTGRPSKKC